MIIGNDFNSQCVLISSYRSSDCALADHSMPSMRSHQLQRGGSILFRAKTSFFLFFPLVSSDRTGVEAPSPVRYTLNSSAAVMSSPSSTRNREFPRVSYSSFFLNINRYISIFLSFFCLLSCASTRVHLNMFFFSFSSVFLFLRSFSPLHRNCVS